MPEQLPVKQDFAALQKQSKQQVETAPDMPSMNEQEKNLYAHHLNNLSHGGYVLQNQGKDVSTVFNVTAEVGGKTYIIPTVWNGKILPPQQAVQMAMQQGIDKFPSYGSEKEANSRYDVLHQRMSQDVEPLLQIIAYLKKQGLM
jgi:hypothetical protein